MPAGRPKSNPAKPEKPKKSKVEIMERKLEIQKEFVQRAADQREKVKKMSPAQKQAYYARIGESRLANKKKLQGDLIFPVKRMRKDLRIRMSPVKRSKGIKRIITTESAIFTAAVVEYLVAEVLELAGECAHQLNKKRLVPRHIMAAIRMDEELATFIPKETVFTKAGMMQKEIPTFLLKNNIPRKDWNKNWNSVMRNVGISKNPNANDTASDVNNNKKVKA